MIYSREGERLRAAAWHLFSKTDTDSDSTPGLRREERPPLPVQNTTSSAAREPRRARRARSHHEGIVHDLVRHIVLLSLDVAILQTYALPSLDLTYHAPGFITVRNFQSRLHPSILLSCIIHIPHISPRLKNVPPHRKGEPVPCQTEKTP